MSNEYVTVRNLITRRVGKVRRLIAERSPNLEIVPDGTKSFRPLTDIVSGEGPDIESYVVELDATDDLDALDDLNETDEDTE